MHSFKLLLRVSLTLFTVGEGKLFELVSNTSVTAEFPSCEVMCNMAYLQQISRGRC